MEHLRSWATDVLGQPPTDSQLLSGSSVALLLEKLSLATPGLATTLQHGDKRSILNNWHRLARELKHSLDIQVDNDVVALVLAGDLQVLFTKVLHPMFAALNPDEASTLTTPAAMKASLTHMSMSTSAPLHQLESALLPSDPEISEVLNEIQSSINSGEFTTKHGELSQLFSATFPPHSPPTPHRTASMTPWLKALINRGGILRSSLTSDTETRYMTVKLLLKVIYTCMSSQSLDITSKSLQLLNAITPLVSSGHNDENEPPVDDIRRTVAGWVKSDGVACCLACVGTHKSLRSKGEPILPPTS